MYRGSIRRLAVTATKFAPHPILKIKHLQRLHRVYFVCIINRDNILQLVSA
ncbi:hypothetical protein HanIR_Chr16g0804121 [Helianthus annuus]|nr:hypothetical protein HanIR_Chr16g0804121 [Helianthus annuus]